MGRYISPESVDLPLQGPNYPTLGHHNSIHQRSTCTTEGPKNPKNVMGVPVIHRMSAKVFSFKMEVMGGGLGYPKKLRLKKKIIVKL